MTNRSPSIRKAREADAFAIAEVQVAVWRDTYPTLVPADYLVKELDTARAAIFWGRRLHHPFRGDHNFVAVIGRNDVVGYLTCGACRDRSLGADGEVYEVYVLAEYQDQGIGRRLMTAGARALKGEGARSLCVEVLDGNPARFFYETLGAQLIARQDRPFAGKMLPSLIYGWPDLEKAPFLVSEKD